MRKVPFKDHSLTQLSNQNLVYLSFLTKIEVLRLNSAKHLLISFHIPTFNGLSHLCNASTSIHLSTLSMDDSPRQAIMLMSISPELFA